MNEILMGRKVEGVSKEEILDHFHRFWRLQILHARPGHVFITSDHPSVWLTMSRNRPGLDIVTLPITPSLMAVIYDRRIAEIVSNTINQEDELTFNAGQIENAVNCFYAPGFLSQEQVSIIKQQLLNKPPSVSEVRGEKWSLSILTPLVRFSFVHFPPPLF